MQSKIIQIPDLTKEHVEKQLIKLKPPSKSELCQELKSKGLCSQEYKFNSKCGYAHTLEDLQQANFDQYESKIQKKEYNMPFNEPYNPSNPTIITKNKKFN